MRNCTRTLALLSILLFTAGCAGNATLYDELLSDAEANQASAPLGGEALLQRRTELDRAVRDLIHFHATLTSLERRFDRGSRVRLQKFVEAYLVEHALPMLEGEWQSQHPELAVIDVNARFVVAELWSKLGARGRTAQMIEAIETRYRGRDAMVVAYPIGAEGTLADGLAQLRRL